MDLSIIVVTWDTRELVLECLASIAAARQGDASSRLDVEVLVIDNGSTDGTGDAVRSAFPDVRLIRLPHNLGFAGGGNAGIRAARGRNLLLLNSDAQLVPGALESSVDFLDTHPDVAILGPQLLNPDGTRQNSIHNFPILTTEVVPKGVFQFLFRSRFPSRRWSGDEPFDVEAITGAAIFVRAAALDAIGLLSEAYFFFLEETDWCWRARQVGWRVVHLPAAEVLHVSGGSSKRKNPELTRIEYHRSLYRFYRNHHGPGRAAAVVLLRFGKALFYVVTQTPLALFMPSIRRRCRGHWAVLAWHLRGCPESVGLAHVPRRAAADPELDAGRPKLV